MCDTWYMDITVHMQYKKTIDITKVMATGKHEYFAARIIFLLNFCATWFSCLDLMRNIN